MTKRVLSITLLLAGVALAGSIRTTEQATPSVPHNSTSVDVSGVTPPSAPATAQAMNVPSGRAASLGSLVSAAAIATPEPATYAFTALALLAFGSARRRGRTR